MLLASLRTRWAGLLGAFVAVALGVALVAAMGLGLASTFGAPEREPVRFAGSPVVVMGQNTLTVPVKRGPDTGHVSKPLAHPHPVDIELLRELRRLGPVQLDGAKRDAVGVDAPVGEVRKVVEAQAGAGARDGTGVRDGVEARDGDEARDGLGARARVLTGGDRRLADPGPERDAEALVAVNSFLGTAGGVSAFVSVFVTASTFAFVVALRRREFGLLRMAGATPGQVRRMLLAEALAVGVVASGAGCALGAQGAPVLAKVLVDAEIAPEWFSIGGAVWPYHLAFWVGVTVAFSGAWLASRRAGRVGPVEALRDASVDTGVMPWSRRIMGGALLAAGLGMLAWTLWSDPSALMKRKTYTTQPMILITALAALTPLLVRPVLRAVRLPGAVGLLVRENSAASVRRTAAVAAPVLVTVALAGSLLGSAETAGEARATEARERTGAELVVTGKNLSPAGAGAGAGREARVAGVAVAAPSASTAVFVREEGTALIRSDARAVGDPAAFAAVSRLPVVAGDVRDLDDRSIVVNEEWEQRRVGERVDVWLGDGRPARLRIAAVLARGTGDNGAYVTTANAAAAPVDRIDVTLRAGADRDEVAGALRADMRRGGGDVQVRTAENWLTETHPATKPQTRLGLLMLLGIALVYTAISLAGTLLMATSIRGSELRSLRLAGATRTQVRAVLAGESLLAVALGTTLGLAVTALNLGALSTGLAQLSAPAGIVMPWEMVGAAAGVCALVGVGAGVLGARRG
ncbi:ABC transporter permease [Streptomyces longisporoflavus]|uniref:ABC transporter permease n=1 Tax=Streptomyces longisporoflavus TaxID=28044 RepID=UPI0019CA8CE5|nr:FtsX-like permease family protein [Streptomyces longisporoflavus]GGV55047.1 ABC transporter permease [Streptomyces longisporoflavus]